MVKILGDNDTGLKYFTDAAQIIGIQRGMCKTQLSIEWRENENRRL